MEAKLLGKIILYLSALSWLQSFLLLLFGSKKNEISDNLNKYGLWAFYSGILTIVLASIYLLFNILSYNFTLSYVWSYSSRKLPFLLLISSFYAGQEGSFLLWALFLSLVGFFLYLYLKKYSFEFLPLSFLSLVVFFITIILIFKSPFADIWETFPDGNIPKDFVPQDGRGLNPVLENYWIAIHPPILFLGYSLLTVPFVLLLSSFVKKDFYGFQKASSFWALLAAGVLGLGIMLGGFWAYETLGWGGYWGWDPVENSSLVPWIFVTALVHTLILQRVNGGFIRTNYILSWLSFVGVLYATYLTRSGVLSDTSVHSFVDPGKVVNALLLTGLGIFILFPIVIFFFATKSIPKENRRIGSFSRESFTIFGTIVLILAALVIIVGTSLPIIQDVIGAPKVALEPSFYNQWMLPIAILILILNALSLYFKWKDAQLNFITKQIILNFSLSLAFAIIFFLFINKSIPFAILVFSIVFAITINLKKSVEKILSGNLKLGAFLSHLGIALLFLGSLLSGGLEETKTINLIEGKQASAFGYDFILFKKEQIELDKPDREKYKFHIKVNSSGVSTVVKPIVYWSEFNNFEQPFFEPDIKTFVTKDLYFSPKSLAFTDLFSPITLKKGQKVPAPWSSNDSIHFVSYDMSSMHRNPNQNFFNFGLVINYFIDGKEFVDTVYSLLNLNMNSFNPVWSIVPTKDFSIGFIKFSPEENLENSTVELAFGQEVFIADVSIKPFILLVWIGVIFTVAGFIIAVFKYRHQINNTNFTT
ncbi:MAG: cytochrome c biogenesis protein CcsA [Ignavibacteria bacterium]|nr:cytochrome c biogenesis protein CcsA [Ignavibacteria bacterium]